jgi:hypothetical protein
MFIRKKKIKNKEYAYLVENKYNKKKKQSRQKSKKYLGKVIKLDTTNKMIKASTIKEAIIKELSLIGFKKEDNKLIKKSIIVDLDNFTVKEKNRNICLELNEGFMCNFTLYNLLKFNPKNLTQKEIIHKLAEAFVSAGINLHHEAFIDIYNNIISPNSLKNKNFEQNFLFCNSA